ncbi:MAG: hypothetical protein JSS07_07685 [Proteobacteria bacterium]|nr:hypothetical protein [Pseudomonadota bacterium]
MLIYNFQNKTNLYSALFITDEYDKEPGCILLNAAFDRLNPRNNSNKIFVTELASLLFNGSDIEHSIKESKSTPITYTIRIGDINKCRQVVDHLMQKQAISAADRSNMEEKIIEVERQQNCKKLLTDNISVAQKEIIEKLISSSIDPILEKISDLPLALKIIFMAFSVHAEGYTGNTGPWWNIESKFLNINTEFNNIESEKLNALKPCLNQLGISYKENSKITDTLISAGGTLPNRSVQRDTIIKYIINKIISKGTMSSSFVTQIKQAISDLKERTEKPDNFYFDNPQHITTLMLNELAVYEQKMNASSQQDNSSIQTLINSAPLNHAPRPNDSAMTMTTLGIITNNITWAFNTLSRYLPSWNRGTAPNSGDFVSGNEEKNTLKSTHPTPR